MGELGEPMERRVWRVNATGMAMFGRWATAVQEAERAGEHVPQLEDAEPEEIATWLHDHGHLDPAVSIEEAGLLIELIVAGGEKEMLRPVAEREARERAEQE